jgi:hypothetical protein
MAFYLEYMSEGTAGRFKVDSVTIDDAVIKAKNKAQELRCTSALLLQTTGTDHAFGAGTIIARYSRNTGWHA